MDPILVEAAATSWPETITKLAARHVRKGVAADVALDRAMAEYSALGAKWSTALYDVAAGLDSNLARALKLAKRAMIRDAYEQIRGAT